MTELLIYVIPNASKTEIAAKLKASASPGFENYPPDTEVLKIKVAAVPDEGKANAELVKFIAKYYQVSKSQVTILKGEKSRNKVIKINDY